jgi:hypothetical protein
MDLKLSASLMILWLNGFTKSKVTHLPSLQHSDSNSLLLVGWRYWKIHAALPYESSRSWVRWKFNQLDCLSDRARKRIYSPSCLQCSYIGNPLIFERIHSCYLNHCKIQLAELYPETQQIWYLQVGGKFSSEVARRGLAYTSDSSFSKYWSRFT